MTDVQIPILEQVSVTKITEDQKNPNRMKKRDLDALAENIRKYGFIVPIITNKEYVIADGSHRLQAAKHLGMEKVSVIRLDVDEVNRRDGRGCAYKQRYVPHIRG